jgi:hypothetical protein
LRRNPELEWLAESGDEYITENQQVASFAALFSVHYKVLVVYFYKIIRAIAS